MYGLYRVVKFFKMSFQRVYAAELYAFQASSEVFRLFIKSEYRELIKTCCRMLPN